MSKSHHSRRLSQPHESASIVSNFVNWIDYVPPNLPLSNGRSKLIIFEDNDPVIKMCIKSRAPTMKDVPRTHRDDLDWFFERLRVNPSVFIRHVGTKEQRQFHG